MGGRITGSSTADTALLMAAAVGATALTMGAAAPAIPAAAGAAGAAGAGAGAGAAGAGAGAGLIGGMTASEAALAGGGAAAGLGSGMSMGLPLATATEAGALGLGSAYGPGMVGAGAPSFTGAAGGAGAAPGFSFSSLMPSGQTLNRAAQLGTLGSAVGQMSTPPPAPRLSFPQAPGPLVASTGQGGKPTSDAAMQALLAQMQRRQRPRVAEVDGRRGPAGRRVRPVPRAGAALRGARGGALPAAGWPGVREPRPALGAGPEATGGRCRAAGDGRAALDARLQDGPEAAGERPGGAGERPGGADTGGEGLGRRGAHARRGGAPAWHDGPTERSAGQDRHGVAHDPTGEPQRAGATDRHQPGGAAGVLRGAEGHRRVRETAGDGAGGRATVRDARAPVLRTPVERGPDAGLRARPAGRDGRERARCRAAPARPVAAGRDAPARRRAAAPGRHLPHGGGAFG